MKNTKKHEQLHNTRKRNEEMERQKCDFILTKIDDTKVRIKTKQQRQEQEMMLKHETNEMKRFHKSKIIKRLNNQLNYEKEIKTAIIEDKMKRAEDFKKEKQMLAYKKKQIASEIQKQKNIF